MIIILNFSMDMIFIQRIAKMSPRCHHPPIIPYPIIPGCFPFRHPGEIIFLARLIFVRDSFPPLPAVSNPTSTSTSHHHQSTHSCHHHHLSLLSRADRFSFSSGTLPPPSSSTTTDIIIIIHHRHHHHHRRRRHHLGHGDGGNLRVELRRLGDQR